MPKKCWTKQSHEKCNAKHTKGSQRIKSVFAKDDYDIMSLCTKISTQCHVCSGIACGGPLGPRQHLLGSGNLLIKN